jgi:uncharacterized protein (TIGR02453 family)
MLQQSTIKFLKDLEKNNNKPWFDAHRAVYEAARKDFGTFIQRVIDKQAKKDPSIKNLVAKDCMFRINRDIRFSKDKTPYKNNFGASINKGGKQSMVSAGYYFHLQPGRSFAGGGIWMPPAPELSKIRQEIDYNYPQFKKIISSKRFKSVYGDLSHDTEFKLTRLPKGYESNNPASEYLKLKSYIAMIEFKDSDLTSKDLVQKTVSTFDALRPLIEFVNKGLE